MAALRLHEYKASEHALAESLTLDDGNPDTLVRMALLCALRDAATLKQIDAAASTSLDGGGAAAWVPTPSGHETLRFLKLAMRRKLEDKALLPEIFALLRRIGCNDKILK
jgi:hypothetical protein